MKDNVNIACNYFILEGDGRRGQELSLQLIEHQNNCIEILDKVKGVISKVSYDDYLTSAGYVVTWQEGLVDCLPLALVITNLTLIQNKLLHMNLTVVSILSKQ